MEYGSHSRRRQTGQPRRRLGQWRFGLLLLLAKCSGDMTCTGGPSVYKDGGRTASAELSLPGCLQRLAYTTATNLSDIFRHGMWNSWLLSPQRALPGHWEGTAALVPSPGNKVWVSGTEFQHKKSIVLILCFGVRTFTFDQSFITYQLLNSSSEGWCRAAALVRKMHLQDTSWLMTCSKDWQTQAKPPPSHGTEKGKASVERLVETPYLPGSISCRWVQESRDYRLPIFRRCLLGEEVASAGAWLVGVPGTPRLPLCAANARCGSSVQLGSLCATQMPGMVHDRAGSLPAI
ncbi:hypothetical protein EK904_010028, partial [Melospiza melodia maxima]